MNPLEAYLQRICQAVEQIPTAPHHSHLPTHPDHRHRSTEVSASQRPDLEDFLREIRALTDLW